MSLPPPQRIAGVGTGIAGLPAIDPPSIASEFAGKARC